MVELGVFRIGLVRKLLLSVLFLLAFLMIPNFGFSRPLCGIQQEPVVLILSLRDGAGKPLKGETVYIRSEEGVDVQKLVTGKALGDSIVLERGKRYIIEYQGVFERHFYTDIVIPEEEGLHEMEMEMVIPYPSLISLPFVKFEKESSRMMKESEIGLNLLAEWLIARPWIRGEIANHTDASGSEGYNLRLSQARAESVVAFLVGKGVEPTRLNARGYGFSQPLRPAPGLKTSSGNRRTEFHLKRN